MNFDVEEVLLSIILPEVISIVNQAIDDFFRTKNLTCPMRKFDENLDVTCSICLENFVKDDLVPDLKCRHFFHKACLEEWFKKKEICPMCRGDL